MPTIFEKLLHLLVWRIHRLTVSWWLVPDVNTVFGCVFLFSQLNPKCQIGARREELGLEAPPPVWQANCWPTVCLDKERTRCTRPSNQLESFRGDMAWLGPVWHSLAWSGHESQSCPANSYDSCVGRKERRGEVRWGGVRRGAFGHRLCHIRPTVHTKLTQPCVGIQR